MYIYIYIIIKKNIENWTTGLATYIGQRNKEVTQNVLEATSVAERGA